LGQPKLPFLFWFQHYQQTNQHKLQHPHSSAISANPFFFLRKLKAFLAMPLGSDPIT